LFGREHQLLGGISRLGQIYNQVKVACPGSVDLSKIFQEI
jgi:hypothetical protein